jgi:transposase
VFTHLQGAANGEDTSVEPEEKIRIVIEELRGEQSIAELCWREGIVESQYYSGSKEFLEAGKARLARNTKRQASSSEVENLRPSQTSPINVEAICNTMNQIV